MTRRCELSGKTVLYGNNVSHANNKSTKRFLPNLQSVSFLSDVLQSSFQFRVTASCIRSVEANNGIDEYLLKTKDNVLSKKALSLKKAIAKRLLTLASDSK